MTRGKLIVVSGPSGAGKSTVISRVLSSRDDMGFSVSATTRSPRDGERDGVNYYFVTRERFMEMMGNGELLECAEYVGNLYGTPKAEVNKRLDTGMSVILDIEVQGAAQVKDAMPEAVTVFLAPPSFEDLEARLRGRSPADKAIDEAAIKRRLETARDECKLAANYDYIIINDNLFTAAGELDAIITAEKCRSADRLKQLKANLKL